MRAQILRQKQIKWASDVCWNSMLRIFIVKFSQHLCNIKQTSITIISAICQQKINVYDLFVGHK